MHIHTMCFAKQVNNYIYFSGSKWVVSSPHHCMWDYLIIALIHEWNFLEYTTDPEQHSGEGCQPACKVKDLPITFHSQKATLDKALPIS